MIHCQGETTFCSLQEAAEMLGLDPVEVEGLIESHAIEVWEGVHGRKHILRQSVRMHRMSELSPCSNSDLSHRQLRVFVVSAEQSVLAAYRGLLGKASKRVRPFFFDSVFDALLNIGRHPPDILIFDTLDVSGDWVPMIHALCVAPWLHGLKIAVSASLDLNLVAGRGGPLEGVMIFGKPISVSDLDFLMTTRTG